MNRTVGKVTKVVDAVAAALVVTAAILVGFALTLTPACGCVNPGFQPPELTVTAQETTPPTSAALESAAPMP
ncbi:MAG: hypothetical protein ACRDG3_09690 [Tepidiformaceae bacterium]